MNKYIYILTFLAFTSCARNKTDKIEETNKEINTSVAEVPVIAEKVRKAIAKTDLELLLEDGLIIADTTESCSSHQWDGNPSAKLVFNYPEGSKIILEEWESSIENNELRLLDFLIFDCNTRNILLKAQYTTADYKIIDVKPELKVQINADLPSLEEGSTRRPFIIKTYKEVNSTINTETEEIFSIPNLTNEELTEIQTEFESRPNLPEDKKLEHADFATGKLLTQLFKGAINGNEESDSLFSIINNKYALDGSISEYYSDLKYLLNEAKK